MINNEVITKDYNNFSSELPIVLKPGSAQSEKFCIDFIDRNTTIFTLRIFDRWGSLIFKSNQVGDCWNGTFNNNSCERDVYTFVLRINEKGCNKPDFIRVGDIILLKNK